ncbi:MAG TPA: membrane protein insertase YidC, partial [Candidatus Acidoferrum sp.]|nr:membrane protein insertase YidC [Candidatus Acidoferrum sp.]
MDSSRVLLAVILSIVLVVAYQELVLKRFFPAPTQQQQQAAEQAKAAKAAQANGQASPLAANGSAAPGAAASVAAPSGQQSTAMTPSMALVPERTVEVDSDFYSAIFTTHGARLKSFVLNRYRVSAVKGSPPYEMV